MFILNYSIDYRIFFFRCPYDSQVMHKSLVKRSESVDNLQEGYELSSPILGQSDIGFEHTKQVPEFDQNGKEEIDGDNLTATHTCNLPFVTPVIYYFKFFILK